MKESSLTQYLRSENKHAFLNQLNNPTNYAWLSGFTQSLLDDLIHVIGKEMALNLSCAKDTLDEISSIAWEEIRTNREEK